MIMIMIIMMMMTTDDDDDDDDDDNNNKEVCLRSVSGTIPGLPSSSLQRSRRTTQQQSHGSERRCPSPSCGLP